MIAFAGALHDRLSLFFFIIQSIPLNSIDSINSNRFKIFYSVLYGVQAYSTIPYCFYFHRIILFLNLCTPIRAHQSSIIYHLSSFFPTHLIEQSSAHLHPPSIHPPSLPRLHYLLYPRIPSCIKKTFDFLTTSYPASSIAIYLYLPYLYKAYKEKGN